MRSYPVTCQWTAANFLEAPKLAIPLSLKNARSTLDSDRSQKKRKLQPEEKDNRDTSNDCDGNVTPLDNLLK